MEMDLKQKVSPATLRVDYKFDQLLEGKCLENPILQFNKWFEETRESNLIREPNAMVLSTATKEGVPSSRVVLLKGYNEKGFVFFTNYLSQKSKELTENPNASLLFFWDKLERSVRIEGF